MSRPFAWIAVALMLLTGIPSGSAQGAPTTRDLHDQATQTANDTAGPVTSIPTVGQAYQDATALVDSTLQSFTDTLRAHNLSVAGLENTTATSVFFDDLDNASVGGVGGWRAADPWRNDSRAGLGATHGWTMTDAKGGYGKMNATLLTPAIDLSAYALANVPYFQAVIGGGVLPVTAEQGSVLLTFQTRFGFVNGKDGGEVVAYLHDPALHADEQAFPLAMMNGMAQRGSVHALDGRAGFTNASDWTPVTFDLTPFLGQTIWVGFHVATSPQASSDPDYLTQLPPGVKPGWQIDQVRVVAPAFPQDVKVYGVQGTGFRLDATDHDDRARPGENVTAHVIVIHAASTAGRVRLRITQAGAAAGPDQLIQDAWLGPGATWTVPITFTMPGEGNSVSLVARADVVSPEGNLTLTDPSDRDNAGSLTLDATTVIRYEATLESMQPLVDDGQTATAMANLTNHGNVPIDLQLHLTESFLPDGVNTTTVARDDEIVHLEPGARANRSWPFNGTPRGLHTLSLNTSIPGSLPTPHLAHFYVHRSPPPIFREPGGAHDPNWSAELATMPIPLDDSPGVPGSMWVARHSDEPALDKSQRSYPILTAGPSAVTQASGATYHDLRISVRWMESQPFQGAISGLGQLGLSITYTNPTFDTSFLQGSLPVSSLVWSTQVGVDPTPATYGQVDQNLTWHSKDLPVNIDPSSLYVDTWSLNGMQLRATALMPKFTFANETGIFIDDLRLTGVPDGKDESWRTDIIHLTGNAGDGGAPAQPSSCTWKDPTLPPPQASQVTPGTSVPVQAGFNCWFTMSAAEAAAWDKGQLPGSFPTLWRDAPGGADTLDGSPSVFEYYPPATTAVQSSDRLTSPVLHFTEASDPLVTFLHRESFGVYANQLTYGINQVGYVELQYRLDDGTWSPFYPIYPDGNGGLYPPAPGLVLANPSGDERKSSTYISGYDGFFQTGPCVGNVGVPFCDADGTYLGNIVNATILNAALPMPAPVTRLASFHLRGQPMLAGVDLANRDVRLGFRASEQVGTQSADENAFVQAYWLLRDLRVTPVSVFAMDGAVDNLSLNLPYDWQSMGVGPNTVVPIHVTVRNTGQFPLTLGVDVNVSRLHGAPINSTSIDLGVLAPNETASQTVPWTVPVGEDTAYSIQAHVRALGADFDENDLNDNMTIGLDGSLVARTRNDLAIQAQISPEIGREGRPRYVSIQVFNHGNEPLTHVTLTRDLSLVAGSKTTLVDHTAIELGATVWPSSEGMRFESLDPRVDGQPYSSDDGFVVPNQPGDYTLTVLAAADQTPDATPSDNFYRGSLSARTALYAASFDDGLDGWTPTGTPVWGTSEGFRSPQGVAAMNATSGALPPDTDGSLMSPTVAIADARAAVLNAFVRYDLETRFDGARFEVSADDGATWIPLTPEGGGLPALVGSNPLAINASPDEAVTAFTGDSHESIVNLDGWVPVSFDLATVPGISEDVVFRQVPIPGATSVNALQTDPLADPPKPMSWYAPWMVPAGATDTGRWEFQNQTQVFQAHEGTMVWSGYASHSTTKVDVNDPSIPYYQGTFDVSKADGKLTLSWWDMRDGTLNSSWQGTGARYQIYAWQPDHPGHWPNPQPSNLIPDAQIQVLERNGPWSHLSTTIENVNASNPLRIRFSFYSYDSLYGDLGWALSGVDLRSVTFDDGAVVPLIFAPTGGWVSQRFSTVASIPATPAAWRSVPSVDDEGLATSVWNLTVAPHVDTRLVSPAIDLGEAGSSNVALNLTHRYNLLDDEANVPVGFDSWTNQRYQGAVVEVSALNRTTRQWDDWKQVFAAPEPPGPTAPRPTLPGPIGAPYVATLPDVGDTFQRFPSAWYQHVMSGNSGPNWYKQRAGNISYVFSGASPSGGSGPYAVDRFDLSAYAGQTIRLGFHAWSGGAVDAQPRWWEIAKIEVRGRVLSSPDLLLRARVGTDNSTLQGNFAMDQLEVAGTRYASSLGVELTQQPLHVAPDGTAIIRGTLVNFGPDARRVVGVGLVQDTTPFQASVLEGSTAVLPAGSRYAAATFAPVLAPAGEPGSSVPFALRLTPDQTVSFHTVRLEAIAGTLGADGNFAFAPPPDDVPGRAARTWRLQVADDQSAEIQNATLLPPWLPAPGLVTLRATLVNTGTAPIVNRTVAVDLFNVNKSRIANGSILVPYLAPGASTLLRGPPLRLPAEGNYTVAVRSDELGIAATSLKARVARGDVAYGTDFAEDAGLWVPATLPNPGETTSKVQWRKTDDEHAFGNASMLIGLNDTEVGQGKKLTSWFNGSLTSPLVDMRGATSDAAVEFWSKPRFEGNGNVSVLAIADDGCTRVLGYAPGGSSPQWTFTRLALGTGCGFESKNVTIKFVVSNGDGAGWRLGAVTLASGELSLSPAGLDFPLTDSAVKDFPLLLTNPGAAPKTVSLSLDRLASNLNPSERSWLQMVPDQVTIAPGASMRVTLRASSPAARGSFSRVLSPQVAATSLDEPFVEVLAPLTLRFAPLARADLAASLTLDGQPGASGIRLEEGVPHQIAVSVTNLGTRDSAPTRVKLWITEDATGLTEWTHEETIPALQAGAPLGVDAVVADAWRPDFGHRGNHTIHVLVDPDRIEVDYDHANDGYAVPIRVIQLIRPDLAIDPASLVVRTPTGLVLHEANPGQVIQLGARIVNLGIADAHDVVVRIYEGGAVLREQALGTLAPGQGVDVSATEFAPDNATRFRVQATTPNLELSTGNNERDLDLPIFPPEIQFQVAQTNLTLQPGVPLDVPVQLVNTGPYPQLLTVTATGDAPAATLSLAKVALAPSESRAITLTITPGPSEPARQARLVLAATAQGRVAQRTLDVAVAAHPGADAIVYRAAGPPQALRVDAQLLNTGNTPLSGDVLLEDAAGHVLGQIAAPDVPPGDSAPITIVGELPASTQPGLVDARLVVRQDAATLGDAPVSAQVEPWGETRLDVVGVSAAGRTIHYALGVTFSGNHDSVREPRAYGLPAGARATFDQPNVRLAPGDRAAFNLTIELPDGLQPGMYQPLVGAIDPAATSAGSLLANLTPLSLDLRAGKATLVNVTRATGTPSAGGLVDYAVQVRNDGDDALRGLPVELYVDGALVALQKVDLAPAESGLVHLAWNATPGLHAIVVAVDPHGAHGGDTAAFGDSLHVPQGPLGAVGSAAKHVPGPSPLALLALVALVGRLWRWRRRGA
ncbi:MAG: hypothetical protein QOE90_1680 [Thermoplasmata archaeon]|nr:hypothetical protein [Thermoplasmata archaeon]